MGERCEENTPDSWEKMWEETSGTNQKIRPITLVNPFKGWGFFLHWPCIEQKKSLNTFCILTWKLDQSS